MGINMINHPPVITIDGWYEPFPHGWFIILISTLPLHYHLLPIFGMNWEDKHPLATLDKRLDVANMVLFEAPLLEKEWRKIQSIPEFDLQNIRKETRDPGNPL